MEGKGGRGVSRETDYFLVSSSLCCTACNLLKSIVIFEERDVIERNLLTVFADSKSYKSLSKASEDVGISVRGKTMVLLII